MKNSTQIRLDILRPYKFKLLLGLVLMLGMVGAQLFIPTILASSIDNLSNLSGSQEIIKYGVLAAISILVYASLNSLRFYLFDRTGNEIITDLRRKLFGSLIRQEISFFDEKKVGEFTSRLSSDVEIIKDAVTIEITMALRALLTCFGGIVMLLTISIELTILLILLTPLSLILAKWLGKKARNYASELQNNLANNIHCAQEYLSNVRVIYSNNVENRVVRHFNNSTEKTLSTYQKNSTLFAMYQFLSSIVNMFSVLILVVLGAIYVTQNAMTLGQLSSFIIYSTMVSSAFGGLSGFWGSWMSTLGATDDLFALIHRKSSSSKQNNTSNQLLFNKQDIVFDNVDFCYPSRPEHSIFKNFNLNIEAGKKTALVGRSGSGKSTIVSLILGCYQLNSGYIRLGKNTISDYGFESFLNTISVVEQEPTIFSGTIAENIKFASLQEEVSVEAIEQAAIKAHIHEFIIDLPQGYQTIVGERGAQLSGGQKQRIAIARAFLRDTNILILDEPTSALDSESATLIRTAINELSKNRTTIVIAHSLAQIIDADNIIVLDKGEIIEQGCHEQLIHNQHGFYKELFATELSITAS
jgi:ATP-binding cassette subfamily B protein